MKLTEHFTTEEVRCPKDKEIYLNLLALAVNCLEPIRQQFGKTTITSGYRTEEQNKACGGAKNSQHLTGQAADIQCTNANILDVYKWSMNNLRFDQLILETNGKTKWVHISYVDTLQHEGKANRQMAFKITK